MNVLEKMKLNGQLNDIYLEIVGATSVLEKMKLNGQINDIYLKLNAGGIDTPSTPDTPTTPVTPEQGAKYWYGMRIRPIGFGTQPDNHIAQMSAEQAAAKFPEFTERDYRYGAVGYAEALSARDIEHYNLTDFQKVVNFDGDIDVAEVAIEDAILAKLKSLKVSGLTQSEIHTYLQAFDLAKGSNKEKIQSLFAKELRKDYYFLGRKTDPEGYKTWLASLELIDKAMLTKHLNNVLIAGNVTPDAYDDKTDELKSIESKLFGGYINLAEAKKQLKELLNATPNLDPALIELINDAINTNGRSKVLPKLQAIWVKSEVRRDAARKANKPKVDPLTEHAELIALAKSHGFIVDVDASDNTIYFETPQSTSSTSADLDDPDEIESFIYDLENAVEKWESEAQAREAARLKSRIDMMNRGKKPNLWKIDIPDNDDWARVSTPLVGYFDDQNIKFYIKYAPDVAGNSETLNLLYSDGGVVETGVETFADVVEVVTNSLTANKLDGLYPELQGNDDLLPGGETYNDMPKEAQAMIDQTVANFPDLMPEQPTDNDQQYVNQLNTLKTLTIADFNTLSASESKAKFYDVLEQQETIIMKLIELDKLDEHTPLILAVGEHIATLKAESVNL